MGGWGRVVTRLLILLVDSTISYHGEGVTRVVRLRIVYGVVEGVHE